MAKKGSPDQKIVMRGIPQNQQAARDLRARKRDEQRPRSAGEIAREALGGFVRRGINNFKENAGRPLAGDPRQDFGRDVQRKSKGRHRDDERSFGMMPEGPGLNIPDMDFGGGLDMSLHPDPMYHNLSGAKKHHEGRRRTVTRTTIRYD